MSYTYDSFQAALALNMAIPNANVAAPNFVAILPTIVDYAEQRCYRELDLALTRQDWQGALTAGDYFDIADLTWPPAPPAGPSAPIPQLLPLVIERVRIILPAGLPLPVEPSAITGFSPCSPVSPEWLDLVYPPSSKPGVPRFFANLNQARIALGPAPDQPYPISIWGMTRPTPLYLAAPQDGTQTTVLTTYVPDLFLAAAMVSASGYQKNFGAQADDPKMAMAWETQYQALLQSAKLEEVRKRFHGWQAQTAEMNPPPTPPPPPPGG